MAGEAGQEATGKGAQEIKCEGSLKKKGKTMRELKILSQGYSESSVLSKRHEQLAFQQLLKEQKRPMKRLDFPSLPFN